MMVEIKRYVIAHDCGTVINPLIVDGQVHGGVSMGIGQSFYEKLIYDENGQLLNASFADYLLPRSTDMRTSRSVISRRRHRSTRWALRVSAKRVRFQPRPALSRQWKTHWRTISSRS